MQDEIVSKTQQKRAMLELQALGVALVELPQTQLDAMQLPAALAAAVAEARRMTRHEAKRRQLQFIGKLMRSIDAEPIREQLAALRGESAQAVAQHRRLEDWRSRLLADDDALTAFAEEFPRADLQALRAAIRNARKEQAASKPPRAYRELFRDRDDAGDDIAHADVGEEVGEIREGVDEITDVTAVGEQGTGQDRQHRVFGSGNPHLPGQGYAAFDNELIHARAEGQGRSF